LSVSCMKDLCVGPGERAGGVVEPLIDWLAAQM
jgi:hypothetical protein